MSEPRPDWSADEALAHLQSLRNEANIAGMARFGIVTDTALGISNTELRAIARKMKRNHARSIALWATDIREARLLAAFTAEPKRMELATARAWAQDFNSWEIVDGIADLFGAAGFQEPLIAEFAADDSEFVRRTAFTMIAWSAVHLKDAPSETFLPWLDLIEHHSTDERNFVAKAVNWALRQIGKRNAACHGPALALARKLATSDDRTARWIGKDAVRKLSREDVRLKIAPRSR